MNFDLGGVVIFAKRLMSGGKKCLMHNENDCPEERDQKRREPIKLN